MTKISIKATKVFHKNYKSTKKIVINRGGTRAGKTYSIMQMFALWLISGQLRENYKLIQGVASVVRKTLPALKATAQKDFEEILENMGIFDQIEVNKTDRYYKYNGRIVEFFSVDDQQKVRGRKRNILFCNEANELDYDTDFFQLLLRTDGIVFIDFNPSDPYIWIKTELEDKRSFEMGDVETIITTYKDNSFLSDTLVREIENISDPNLREVYVHGLYGIVEGVIFKNVNIIQDHEFPGTEDLKKHGYGLDFGFTNDPTAVYECGIKGGEIYLREIIYEKGLTNPEIAKLIPNKHLECICDSAEPKSIKELRNNNIFARPTKKGKDSITSGIDLLKQYKINVTASSKGIIKERTKYVWKTRKNDSGQIVKTNQPVDSFNHAWDAVRYWALIKLSRPSVLAIG